MANVKRRRTYYTPQRVAKIRSQTGEEQQETLKAADGFAALGLEKLWLLPTAPQLPRACDVVIGDRGWKPLPGEPWKLTNGELTMPTNDFAAYYQSGLDSHGLFDPDLADRNLLKNELYPEKGPNWGVDDGFGWKDDDGTTHALIAFYNHWHVWYKVRDIINTLCDAYLYTDNPKYARAGLVLLDRIADLYPEMDISIHDEATFFNSHGGTGQGRIVGSIWECGVVRRFITAYDAFFPLLQENDPGLVGFLHSKAHQFKLENDKSTTYLIQKNFEEGVARQILEAVKTAQIRGNFGMHQATLAMAAVVVDDPEGYTKETIDFIFKPGETTCEDGVWRVTGGDLLGMLVNVIDRDGHGYEASPGYNRLHIGSVRIVADILEGYDGYKGINISTYPKYIKLLKQQYPLVMLNRYIPSIGDAAKTGNPLPASQEGMSHSVNLTGYGFTALRDGAGEHQRAFWLYYGRNKTGHAHNDALNMGLYGFGLDLSPDLGYPETTGFWPKRMNWTMNTTSHNLVLVDRKKQRGAQYNSIPHYEGSGPVQLIDVEAPKPYPQTSLYRRTTAMIRVDDANSYYVDYFRVRGGNEHHYLFHGAEGPTTVEGLELIDQPTGTYAGPDVPFADTAYDQRLGGHINDGFNYLYDVQRNPAPPEVFSVDWDVHDTWGVLEKEVDMHLKVSMIGDNGEIALAHGDPPQLNKPGNPRRLRYLIAHRSGDGLASFFNALFQPYKEDPFIKAVEIVSMHTRNGKPDVGEARALKVKLTSGRVDYVINSLDSDTTYEVDGKLLFQGFFGVFSQSPAGNGWAYLLDGTTLGEINQLQIDEPAGRITGKVIDFTREMSLQNEIRVRMELNVDTSSLVGRSIFIENDGERNAVYEIKAITSKKGDILTLDVGDTTLIRSFADPEDQLKGYQYNFQPGAAFSIPLAHYR